MSEPSYQLTDQQAYAQHYPGWDGHHPEPMTEPKQPSSDEQQPRYEDFYPDSPAPALSAEDEAAYRSYFPHDVTKETNR